MPEAQWLDTNSLKRNLQRRLSLYQNRNQEAIAQFQSILENIGTGNRGGNLLRLGNIYEKTAIIWL
jgi:hypothetical protein